MCATLNTKVMLLNTLKVGGLQEPDADLHVEVSLSGVAMAK